MSVQSLVARIEEVFPEFPLPDMTLRQAQLADETLDREISQEEWDTTGRIDHAVVWKAIEPAALIACDQPSPTYQKRGLSTTSVLMCG